MLFDAGAAEVHVRISSPPVVGQCFYGIDLADPSEMIASGRSVEEVRERIGATSFAYLWHDGLVEATGARRRRCAGPASPASIRRQSRPRPRNSGSSLRAPSCGLRRVPLARWVAVQLFHYHLVTSRVREVEARYVGKLGFDLVARHGRVGEELMSFEPGVSWEELDARGFKLRLTELEKGAVNVVVQPGQWPGRASTTSASCSTRTSSRRRSSAPSGTISASRSTAAGGRSSRRTPATGSRSIRRGSGSTSCSRRATSSSCRSCTSRPTIRGEGEALAEILDAERDGASVVVGDTVVRFVRGGPQGRPELFGELFV